MHNFKLLIHNLSSSCTPAAPLTNTCSEWMTVTQDVKITINFCQVSALLTPSSSSNSSSGMCSGDCRNITHSLFFHVFTRVMVFVIDLISLLMRFGELLLFFSILSPLLGMISKRRKDRQITIILLRHYLTFSQVVFLLVTFLNLFLNTSAFPLLCFLIYHLVLHFSQVYTHYLIFKHLHNECCFSHAFLFPSFHVTTS